MTWEAKMERTGTIEVFTDGCPSCEGIVAYGNELACSAPGYELLVWNSTEGCESSERMRRMRRYGIKELPAVVVDGQLLACCR